MVRLFFMTAALLMILVISGLIGLNGCQGKVNGYIYRYNIKEYKECDARVFTPEPIDSAGLVYIADSIRAQQPSCKELKVYFYDREDWRQHLSWADVWYNGQSNEVTISK